uniref:Small secreted gut protein n=1 Tax=Mayetiola destructor TaxID=39758 RepID=A4K7M8_MAYDE|nr:small secreted gut protein [Mayetiola destructor]
MKLFTFIVIGALAFASAKSIEESSSIEKFLLAGDVSVVVERTQCFVAAVAKVSKENDLSELWAQPESIINDHLNNWAQCSSAGNKLAQIVCNVKEGLQVFKPLNEYLSLVAAKNPQLIKLIALEYYSSCSSASAPFDQLLMDSANGADFEY